MRQRDLHIDAPHLPRGPLVQHRVMVVGVAAGWREAAAQGAGWRRRLAALLLLLALRVDRADVAVLHRMELAPGLRMPPDAFMESARAGAGYATRYLADRVVDEASTAG